MFGFRLLNTWIWTYIYVCIHLMIASVTQSLSILSLFYSYLINFLDNFYFYLNKIYIEV